MILTERLLTATVGGEHPHQPAVGRLVQGVDDDKLLVAPSPPRYRRPRQAGGEFEQQPQVRLAHRVAPAAAHAS